jgi:DNA replication and checkpoint protein
MDELNRLRRELKAWERKFRVEHDGRDPTKDDTRRDPAIGVFRNPLFSVTGMNCKRFPTRVTAAKYKLYRSLSKAPAKPLEPATTTPRTKARKRMRGEDIPITPSESARKKRTRISSFTKASQALHSSSSHLGGGGLEEEDEDVIPESPIKPSRPNLPAGPSSGVFRPLFPDSLPSKPPQVDDSGVFRSLFTEEISSKRRRGDDISGFDMEIVVDPSQDAIDGSLNSQSSNSTALRPPSPVPDLAAQSLKHNPKVKAARLPRKKNKSGRRRSESAEEADDEEIFTTTVKWKASGTLTDRTEQGGGARQDQAEIPEYQLSDDDFPHGCLFDATEVSSEDDAVPDERRNLSRPSKLNRLAPIWAAGESEEDGDEWDSTPEWAAEL